MSDKRETGPGHWWEVLKRLDEKAKGDLALMSRSRNQRYRIDWLQYSLMHEELLEQRENALAERLRSAWEQRENGEGSTAYLPTVSEIKIYMLRKRMLKPHALSPLAPEHSAIGRAPAAGPQPPESSAIARAPGGWMLAVAGTIFSKKTRKRVFDQVVADFRDEYFEALNECAGRARMLFLIGRHWSGFILAVVMQGGRELAKAIKTLKGAG